MSSLLLLILVVGLVALLSGGVRLRYVYICVCVFPLVVVGLCRLRVLPSFPHYHTIIVVQKDAALSAKVNIAAVTSLETYAFLMIIIVAHSELSQIGG